MERYLKGDVVIIPFPYSNLRQCKKRPALVLASLKGEDVILCQISSQFRKHRFAVPLEEQHFVEGGLPIPSFVHCELVFTVSKRMIIRKVGTINMGTLVRVLQMFGMVFSIGDIRAGVV